MRVLLVRTKSEALFLKFSNPDLLVVPAAKIMRNCAIFGLFSAANGDGIEALQYYSIITTNLFQKLLDLRIF